MASSDDNPESLVPTYSELFPALPLSGPAESPSIAWAVPKLRNVSDVFSIPVEEQRYRQLDESTFGNATARNRICADVAGETDTKIEMSLSKDLSLSVCITGKRENAAKAKKLILQKLQTQASFELQIPKAHHVFLIGKEGKIVKEIMESTSTTVHIPKADDPSTAIRIVGTTDNIRLAVNKIQLIADEKAKMDFVRLAIPKAFHPLIAGYQQSFVKNLIEKNAVRIHMPPYNVDKDEIVVSGEKDGVARAVSEINNQYELIKRTCGELPVPVDKAKHKYLRGARGVHLENIFKTTGVHVELPSAESADNTVLLRGDTSKLATALALVYEKANSMTTVTIKAPNWLHRHLLGAKGVNIKPIHDSHPNVHVQFQENDTIDVEGPTSEAPVVAQILSKSVADLLARLTYVDLKGNPQYFRHLIGRDGSTINKIKSESGVQITMPANDGVSDLIRIEGPPAGVATAKAALEAILKKLADSKAIDLIVEQRFHSQLIGHKGTNIKEIVEKFGGISINFPDSGKTSDIITLRGDKKNVDLCEKHIKAEVKKYIEASFVLEVPLFSQFIKHIIGKAGSTLNQIKEETDTRITIPRDGSETALVKITGIQKNCEAARDRILKIQAEQANIVSETIEIDPKFHNAIIGAKGKVLKDIILQCGGVNVNFPKEKGSSKVTVRGAREDVEKAKALLLELATEKALNSFTLEVPVKKQFHRFIIGQKGSGIAKIKDLGVRVIFPAAQDEEADTVTIIGKESACQEARDKILARVKELESIVDETIEVPANYHRNFFQRQGQLLKEITDEFGVVVNFPREGETVTVRGGVELVSQAIARIQQTIQDFKEEVTKVIGIPAEHHGFVVGAGGKNVQRIQAERNVNIKFPRRNPKGSTFTTTDANVTTVVAPAATATADASAAEPASTDAAEASSSEQATSSDAVDAVDAPIPTDSVDPAVTTESIEVAEGDEAQVIAPADRISIKGKPENIALATADLLALVPESESFPIASEHHGSLIGPKGESIRKLMTEFEVNIKVPNQSEKADAIILRGLRANIENVKVALAKRVAELEADKADRVLRNFKLEVAVPAKHHATIIGKAGAGVQKLREELGVQFDFPKRGKEDAAVPDSIIITGYEAKAIKARDVLLAKVAELDKLVTREVDVDPRVHARIIGGRGAGIKALQDKFKVRVNFPRDKSSGIISVVGQFDDVEDATNDILNKAEEFMEAVLERESTREFERAPSKAQAEAATSAKNQEFKVREAPWNGADQSAFPTLGASSSTAATTTTKAPQGAWGARK
jgi:polyribonucleotide nucleotidyltransferase